MQRILSLVVAGCLAGPGLAQDAPRVAVDVAPLYGLVARVMDGVGAPGLILRQGASPHDYALRPSEARLLQEADVVFRVGDALTPWLDAPLESLAEDAVVVTVMEVPGTHILTFREGMKFETHGHGEHGHDGHGHDAHMHEGHGHDEHDQEERGHEDHAHDGHGHSDHGHDGHMEGHMGDAHHEHHHSGADPHAWMDPANAVIWTEAIAETLSEADPANMARYRENALVAVEEIRALEAEMTARLTPFATAGFVVFHDAYQYFEDAFGLRASGAISLGDAAQPGAARLTAIRDGIAEEGIQCVFSEPQFNADLVRTVTEGTGARIAVLDPMGAELDLGPDFYSALMRGMAEAMAECFDTQG